MNSSYIVKMLAEISTIMNENKDRLIELDSVVGDGDLGLTMTKGFAAASEFAAGSDETDAGKMLYGAGKAMSSAAPSTMGTLMSIGLMQGGKVLKGKTELSNEDIVEFLAAYEKGLMTKGKAKLGEKTFLDGLTGSSGTEGCCGSMARSCGSDCKSSCGAGRRIQRSY